jgi:hypothetical protein
MTFQARNVAKRPDDLRLQKKITPEMEKHKWQPGKSGNQSGKRPPKGQTLYGRLQEILRTRRTDGKQGTRLDAAAEAYVRQMESGSFIHLKEVIDRQEGKVPNRVANADGSNMKAYVGIPVDGPDAP